MRSKLSFLGFVLLASTLIISGCALTTDETTEVPVVVTTDVTPEGPVDMEYAVARDSALAYIGEKHGEQPPPSGSAWEWESPAPDPLAVPDSYHYTAGDWEATISRLVVVPDSAAYRVKVINRSTGFRWEGEVDAAAQVMESPPRELPSASEWVLDARDAALAYLVANFGDQAPSPNLAWTEEYLTPEEWVGSSDWEFTAEEWVVTVHHAVLPPERTVYQVTVVNRTTGFQWEGKVDATGHVAERLAPEEVLAARDAASAYIRHHYDEEVAPAPGRSWTEERTTPEGLVGSESYAFFARDWTVTVSYPVVAPDAVVYQVVANNQTTGFQWEGEVRWVTGGGVIEAMQWSARTALHVRWVLFCSICIEMTGNKSPIGQGVPLRLFFVAHLTDFLRAPRMKPAA